MTTVLAPTTQLPRMQPQNLARNGRPVSTSVEEQTRRLANQILAYEGKELFSALGRLPALSTDLGSTRTRWAFRSKISPHISRVVVMMRMALQDDGVPGPGGGPVPSDCYATFEMFDASNASLGVVEHHYGSTQVGVGTTDTPDTWNVVFGFLDVPPGGEVSGIFTEHAQARLISALVYELGPDLDTSNGYLGMAPPQGANIYADDRERLTDIVNETWLGGASHVVNINCNDDGSPFVHTGTTPTNIIDRTSTTVSAATPGFFFDGTGKALSSAPSTVNVEMWILGSSTDESYLDLYDSTGAVVMSVAFSGGLGWTSSTVFQMPTTPGKYDLRVYSGSGETATIYAVSIYEVG